MSHDIEPMIREIVQRPDAALVAGLVACGVATVVEALGPEMAARSLMGPAMQRRTGRGAVGGPAITAQTGPRDNLMMHVALSLATPGDVLVVTAGQPAAAQWGELACTQALATGLAATVVDGPVRDVDAVNERGFSTWASSVSPLPPTKATPGWVNVAVSCAGVIVHPGDIVLGDGDGVVVVPRAAAADVLAEARARVGRERELLQKIKSGTPLATLLGVEQRVADIGVMRVIDDAPPAAGLADHS